MIFNGGVFVRRYLFAIPACLDAFRCISADNAGTYLRSGLPLPHLLRIGQKGGLCCRYESMFEHDPTISFWLCSVASAAPQIFLATSAKLHWSHPVPGTSSSARSPHVPRSMPVKPRGAKNKRWARLNHDFDVVVFVLGFFRRCCRAFSSLVGADDHCEVTLSLWGSRWSTFLGQCMKLIQGQCGHYKANHDRQIIVIGM